jgi:uncharacterized phage-like protein YoqJ
MNTNKKLTISCIGHRASGLWGYDLNDEHYKILYDKLKQSLIDIMQKHKGQQFHIVSGICQGTEQLFCVAALRLRESYPIHLECVIPHLGYEQNWDEKAKSRFNSILKSCNQRTYLDKKFSYYNLERKNQYIIGRSDYVIAYYINDNDGVCDSIELAKTLKKEIIYIE